MNRYQPSHHRSAFAIAAIALTAMTFGLAVVAPSAMRPDGQAARVTTLARGGSAAPTEVIIVPARIDVIATRERKVAAERGAAPAI